MDRIKHIAGGQHIDGRWTTDDSTSHYGQAVWQGHVDSAAIGERVRVGLDPIGDYTEDGIIRWADDAWAIVEWQDGIGANVSALNMLSGTCHALALDGSIYDSPIEELSAPIPELIHAGRLAAWESIADWERQSLGLVFA
jgi:hypothetical protein